MSLLAISIRINTLDSITLLIGAMPLPVHMMMTFRTGQFSYVCLTHEYPTLASHENRCQLSPSLTQKIHL